MSPNGIQKTIRWTYVQSKEVRLYTGLTWRKKIYKKTLKYVRNKINKDLDDFIKKREMFDNETQSLIFNKWCIYVEIPKFKEIKNTECISKTHIKYNKYLVCCHLKCKINIQLFTN